MAELTLCPDDDYRCAACLPAFQRREKGMSGACLHGAARTDYQERRAERAERYETYADNAASRSDAAYQQTQRIGDMIPLGQPVLVGHYSEGRARRDVERMNAGMRRSVDEADRASYWRGRAEAIANDTSISLLDPDAVPLLEAKIDILEEEQASDKRVNKALKSGKLDGLTEDEVARVVAYRDGPPPDWGRRGVPAFVFTNRNANIRRYRQRLVLAQQAASKRWGAEERRDLAIGAYYHDRHPTLKESVLARVSAWARASGDKVEWREFKHLMIHVVTDDEIDALVAQCVAPAAE